MSSITLVCLQLIILLSKILSIHLVFTTNQCDFLSAFHLQSATYIHSVILRVQAIDSSSSRQQNILRKVLVREVIKIPHTRQYPVKMNDIIIIRINDDNPTNLLDDSCWHLLQISTIDVILFLNETRLHEFNLFYPPVESTLRVRQHIDTVLHHGKLSEYCQTFMSRNLLVNYVVFPSFVNLLAGVSRRVFTDSSSSPCALTRQRKSLAIGNS